jgi:hypothetical protein
MKILHEFSYMFFCHQCGICAISGMNECKRHSDNLHSRQAPLICISVCTMFCKTCVQAPCERLGISIVSTGVHCMQTRLLLSWLFLEF